MNYNFDNIVNRYSTYCMKYDGLQAMYPNADNASIPLMVADMDFQTAPPILDALHQTVDFGIFGYTSDKTESKYAEAVCTWWKKRFDTQLNPDDIIYSNGTVEAIDCAIRAFTKTGDGVIVQRPVYGHFSEDILAMNRKPVSNHLLCDENGYYTIDFDDLEKKCADPENRVMIFCSPANPVGRVWTQEEIQKVADITRRHHILLISDEVHCDIIRAGQHHLPILKAVEDTSNIIMMTAINKTFNLAGLQCSNIVIPDSFLKARFLKAFGMHLPTPFAVSACIAAYTDPESENWLNQLNAYLDDNLTFTKEYFAKHLPWIKLSVPEGTYCVWLDLRNSGLPDEEIHKRIYLDANVFLQDGLVHDPEHGHCFQRICVPCPRSVLKEAYQRIANQFQDIQ